MCNFSVPSLWPWCDELRMYHAGMMDMLVVLVICQVMHSNSIFNG
jgi:hypothetical protein